LPLTLRSTKNSSHYQAQQDIKFYKLLTSSNAGKLNRFTALEVRLVPLEPLKNQVRILTIEASASSRQLDIEYIHVSVSCSSFKISGISRILPILRNTHFHHHGVEDDYNFLTSSNAGKIFMERLNTLVRSVDDMKKRMDDMEKRLDEIEKRLDDMENKASASRQLNIDYIIHPTAMKLASEVLQFVTGAQPKLPPIKRFRSSKSSYWKCAKALKMEIGDFCNRANMLIGERNCLSHFSSAEHLDSDVEMFKRSIIHYPEARLNVSRHIADAFLIIDNYHKIREFFKTQQE